MIDVTLENFEAEVIQASMDTPVLVDFWAPWCGPCKALGPLLEKLELDYAGRFKLVKINSDDEQQLASAFGIRSIPTCILMLGGRPADGFTGALTEGQLREFLDKHVPGADALTAEAETQEAEALLQAGDTAAALDLLRQALATDPANDDTRHELCKLLLLQGELEEAEAALAPALAQIPRPLRFEALTHILKALRFVRDDASAQQPLAAWDARIAANRRDFEARFAKSQVLMAQAQWTEAMDELLEIVMRDKQWAEESARKAYVAILEWLTPAPAKGAAQTPGKAAGGIELTGVATTQQDPQAELVSRYRRRLSMALN